MGIKHIDQSNSSDTDKLVENQGQSQHGGQLTPWNLIIVTLYTLVCMLIHQKKNLNLIQPEFKGTFCTDF